MSAFQNVFTRLFGLDTFEKNMRVKIQSEVKPKYTNPFKPTKPKQVLFVFAGLFFANFLSLTFRLFLGVLEDREIPMDRWWMIKSGSCRKDFPHILLAPMEMLIFFCDACEHTFGFGSFLGRDYCFVTIGREKKTPSWRLVAVISPTSLTVSGKVGGSQTHITDVQHLERVGRYVKPYLCWWFQRFVCLPLLAGK